MPAANPRGLNFNWTSFAHFSLSSASFVCFLIALKKINEIYLPRNFIRNLFILLLFTFLSVVVFSSSSRCLQVNEHAGRGVTLLTAASVDPRSLHSEIFQFSFPLHWFVYFPFPSSDAFFSLRWLSLLFIKLGVFPIFQLISPACMHKLFIDREADAGAEKREEKSGKTFRLGFISILPEPGSGRVKFKESLRGTWKRLARNHKFHKPREDAHKKRAELWRKYFYFEMSFHPATNAHKLRCAYLAEAEAITIHMPLSASRRRYIFMMFARERTTRR